MFDGCVAVRKRLLQVLFQSSSRYAAKVQHTDFASVLGECR